MTTHGDQLKRKALIATFSLQLALIGASSAWAAPGGGATSSDTPAIDSTTMRLALARLETDENVRVVVVSGEGGNFSAGQDLKQFFRALDASLRRCAVDHLVVAGPDDFRRLLISRRSFG